MASLFQSRRGFWSLAVATGLAWQLTGPVALLAGLPSARIEYKLPKSTTLGEPAIMTVRLQNTTGARIVADFGVDDQTEFVFRQTRPDGSLVKVQPSIERASRLRTARLMLRGNLRTVIVVLDQWLDLSQTGRHQLDVEFTGSCTIEGGDEADLKRTASLLIDVTPRNPARLEKRAAEWLKEVSMLSLSGEARAAAAALTAMTDPVVIPYLELATARTRSQKYLDALDALKTPEARGALERLARNQDPEVRAKAQKTLSRGR